MHVLAIMYIYKIDYENYNSSSKTHFCLLIQVQGLIRTQMAVVNLKVT